MREVMFSVLYIWKSYSFIQNEIEMREHFQEWKSYKWYLLFHLIPHTKHTTSDGIWGP
jgi:3-methyladenine DNA glycosylase/8-oxoguanine DNA glycosylase